MDVITLISDTTGEVTRHSRQAIIAGVNGARAAAFQIESEKFGLIPDFSSMYDYLYMESAARVRMLNPFCCWSQVNDLVENFDDLADLDDEEYDE